MLYIQFHAYLRAQCRHIRWINRDVLVVIEVQKVHERMHIVPPGLNRQSGEISPNQDNYRGRSHPLDQELRDLGAESLGSVP